MATCPNTWSPSLVMRTFRAQILATWTLEEIERVTTICDAAMLPADLRPGDPVMAQMPLTVAAGLARRMGH